MPTLKTFHLFISHAWSYDADYRLLVKKLDAAPNFKWKNYSVPSHNSLLDPDDISDVAPLIEELRSQIRPVHCVLVISGMYLNHSEWIQTEIDIAKEYMKPIIGLESWGRQKIPQAVQDAVKVMLGWDTDLIIDALRKFMYEVY